MSVSKHPAWQEFVQAFNRIARHRHRYDVFRDFVTMAAISLHNAIHKNERLETEYLQIVGRYEKEDVHTFCLLLAKLVILLDPEPYDVLGALYMSLELGSANMGQYFTPPELSELMARIQHGDGLRELPAPFVTLCEPACGSGGMVLAFTKVMRSHGHNPAETMWVQCQDIDRLAALMCYLQLALWNVPAVVIVGNTLAGEAREVFHTPQHYLGFWNVKLRRRQRERAAAQSQARREPDTAEAPATGAKIATSAGATVEKPDRPFGMHGRTQFDFGF